MILALPQGPDPAVAMVRAEARVRRAVVAVPLASELPAVRAGAGWADFAADVEGRLDAVPEGFARRDRPLLISAREPDASDLDSWRLMGPVRRMVEAMSDKDFRANGGAGFSTSMGDLPPADQRLLRDRVTPPNGPQPDDRLRFAVSPQIAFYDEQGNGAGITVGARTAPFDPTRYLERMRFREPDPVPQALARALAGTTVAPPASALALPAWAELLGKGRARLRVDARAKAWRVALGAPGASVGTVEALRAVARAQRLYWRPVGDAWILAASPGDPRPFASDLAHAGAMADLIPLLDRMARAGLLSEDMLALLVDARDLKIGALSPEDVDRIRRLLASGTAWKGKGAELDAMLASPKIANATLGVVFSMTVGIENAHGESNVGVMLP